MPKSIVLFIVGALLAGSGREVGSSTSQVPVAMTGAWCGTATAVVDWVEQPGIGVTLFITSEGRVNGGIGDAVLRSGRFERDRRTFDRLFSAKTEWVVLGQLEGPLIRGEGVRRTHLSMPLIWMRDHFEGSFTAWDPTAPGPENRVTSTGRMRLDRLW